MGSLSERTRDAARCGRAWRNAAREVFARPNVVPPIGRRLAGFSVPKNWTRNLRAAHALSLNSPKQGNVATGTCFIWYYTESFGSMAKADAGDEWRARGAARMFPRGCAQTWISYNRPRRSGHHHLHISTLVWMFFFYVLRINSCYKYAWDYLVDCKKERSTLLCLCIRTDWLVSAALQPPPRIDGIRPRANPWLSCHRQVACTKNSPFCNKSIILCYYHIRVSAFRESQYSKWTYSDVWLLAYYRWWLCTM